MKKTDPVQAKAVATLARVQQAHTDAVALFDRAYAATQAADRTVLELRAQLAILSEVLGG